MTTYLRLCSQRESYTKEPCNWQQTKLWPLDSSEVVDLLKNKSWDRGVWLTLWKRGILKGRVVCLGKH